MKACGIIVEYNPFHNGHLYHVEEARKQSNSDVIIAVMSGNFLQRGEPAIVDKWSRADAALKNGVDLVIELPVAWAVQSADYFAQGGVKLLQAMQCESLCFGTDSTEKIDYAAFGQFVVENQALVDKTYQQLKQKQLSYPQQMTAVFRQIYPELALDFTSPNHILGLSYAKENARYSQPMELFPLPRKTAAFHETSITGEIASATAIRQALLANQQREILATVPSQTAEYLSTMPLISWENYWPLLKYKIISSSVNELREIYQVKEGLEYRLKEAALQAESFVGFMNLVKTKRYTWTRLQRLATYLLINVRQTDIEAVWENSYLRVLGFTQKGRDYLKEKKQAIQLPIISRVSKENSQQLDLDILSGKIYQLGQEKIKEQDFGRFPIHFSSES